MSMARNCVFCGGYAIEVETLRRGDMYEHRMKCSDCGRRFVAFTRVDDDSESGARCTVMGCPGGAKCETRFHAERCPVYRMLELRRMQAKA